MPLISRPGTVGLEVVHPTPTVPGREISGIHMGTLMNEPKFVPLSQWVGRTKNVVRQNVVLVGVRPCCGEAENYSKSELFHKIELINLCLLRREDQAAATLSACRFLS